MQLPKTTVPAPVIAPQAPSPPVTHAQKPAGRGWIWFVVLIAVAGGAYFLYTRAGAPADASVATNGIRTYTVQGGKVEQTLRLTGSTSAEKYSSLLAPQIRGSRSGYGRQERSFKGGGGGDRGSGGMSGGGGRSSGGGSSGGSGGSSGGGSAGDSGGSSDRSSSSSSSSSGSSSSSAGSSGSSGGGGSSGGVQSSRSASAMRSATSRVSGGGGSSRSSGGSSQSSAASAAMGADGLGSSASSLPGGGGGGSPGGGGGGGGSPGGGGGRGGPGGGGMSEFMMNLQDAAKPGSLVKKGTPVAEFDRQYMLQRLEDYRSSIIQTEANYKKLVADLDLSKKLHQQTIHAASGAYEKAKLDLKTLPVLSDMDSERRKLALEEAEARYNQLKKEVQYVDEGIRADRKVADLEIRQSRLELRRAETNVDRLVMKAPIDGLVVMQNMLRGSEFDQIKVGDQLFSGQMFMQIVDPSSMIVSAKVNQLDVERLRIGQKARMSFDAFPGLELPGHIYAIGSVGQSSRYRPDWVKEMTVVLKIDQMDPRVIPDLSVSADVILDTEDAPVLAPREAVIADAGSAGQPTAYRVFVRSAEGGWRKQTIELGKQSNTFVAVKSGLRPGEIIAVERPPDPGAQSGPPAKS